MSKNVKLSTKLKANQLETHNFVTAQSLKAMFSLSTRTTFTLISHHQRIKMLYYYYNYYFKYILLMIQ